MQNILITGGTGLVGRALTKLLLGKGYSVTILTRSGTDARTANVSYAKWDVKKKTIDKEALSRADAIVHLAGAGVMDHKWNASYRKEILDSRTDSIRLITETLAVISHKVKVIVSSSATGWYGPDRIKGHVFKENDPAYDDFFGTVCREWESAAEEAAALNIRICKLRTGIVLANEGGAFKEFKHPLKFGIAAILGGGKQVVSWIHIDDLCRAYVHAIEETSMAGSYNAVASVPVTNKELILKTAEQYRGKFFIPLHVPAFVLRTMLGERSIEILKSVSVSNARLHNDGFTFLYPNINAALERLNEEKS